jgi:two-component sensor histidine kinase
MIETTIRDKYYSLLRFHFANPQEDYLAQAAELGKALVMANIPPEEIAELHEDALQRLGVEFPEAKLIDAAKLISQPLMELLMAYGMAFRKRLDERKRAENQLNASLKEKVVLLREIHHRVKNNLQVVSSLLNMQARATRNKDAIAILSESRSRINAMGLIHSQLYESENLSEINMKGFMDKLMVQLLQIYSVPETKITPVVHAVECSLPISIAVPVGLIVNELLTNAFKHAFVNRKEGNIEVSLSASEKGVVNLTVSDDGVGLPEGFDIKASKTLGMRVVKLLTEEQLDGNLEVFCDKGATFKVEFEMARE